MSSTQKVFIVLLFFLAGNISATAQNYYSSFGSSGSGNGQFNNAVNIISDGSYLYVTDQLNNRIQKFDKNSNAAYVMQFGGYGSGNGQLSSPRGTVIDASGNIYVADAGNNRVEIFNSSGVYVSQFGSAGSGNGQFNTPSGIAIDATGNIYVTDSNNNRVQKFNSAGVYQSQWGIAGTGNGQFNTPIGIVIDGSGKFYVSDSGNNRIQVFNSSGVYVSQFGSAGNVNGYFSNPWFISIDLTGNIYVADTGNSRIQQFTNAGSFISTSGNVGGLHFPTGVFVDASNNLYITSTNFVQVINNSCVGCQAGNISYKNTWGVTGSGNSQFNNPTNVTITRSGKLYITDELNHRIQKFDNNVNKTFIVQFGGYGSGNGQLMNPRGTAVDSDGNVYVANTGNNRIEKFNQNGVYLSQFGSAGSGNGQFNTPSGIAIDVSGNIYVTDTYNNRVQKFDATGVYQSQWGVAGTGNGQFNGPIGIAIEGSGNIYISDSGNSRVQKFSSAGVYINQFGPPHNGGGASKFVTPWFINIDALGNIYVADAGQAKILKYDNSGGFITQFGTAGTGNGQFNGGTKGVAIDALCNVYVADNANNRIQVFNSGIQSSITSVSPSSALAGSEIAITGTGLSGVSRILFNTTPATNYIINSSTQITVVVPDGATSGNISLTIPCSPPITSNNTFEVLPVCTVCENTTYQYKSEWRMAPPSGSNGQVSIGGYDLAKDSEGNIYVLGNVNQKINKYTKDGIFISSIASWQLPFNCNSFTIDAFDNVYYTLNNFVTLSYSIIKSTTDGSIITQWGSYGTGNGQFNNLATVDVDLAGNVYVVDFNNKRVQKFNGNGTYITQWPLAATFDYSHWAYIALDKSGNVYVSDKVNIYKYASTNGISYNLIFSFDTHSFNYNNGNGSTDNRDITGISLDEEGNIYVSDGYDFLGVQKFTNTGDFLAKWGSEGLGNGQFEGTAGSLVVDCDIYVADSGNDRIQIFSQSNTTTGPVYNYAYQWGSSGTGNGQFGLVGGIAYDQSNKIYVVDAYNSRVQVFNNNGTYYTKWGTAGSGNGQFNNTPECIAIDQLNQYVYVSDNSVFIGQGRVQKFTLSGQYISTLISSSQSMTINGLTVDKSGNVFVLDRMNGVLKYNSTGTLITQWGNTGPGLGNGQFNVPMYIAVDVNGNIYVSDTGNNRIQKFTNNGIYVTQWGTLGTGSGQFSYPQGITIDATGNVYVVDGAPLPNTEIPNYRVQQFCPTNGMNYKCVGVIGSSGSAPSQFTNPVGIIFNPIDNNLYVCDVGNTRIEVFGTTQLRVADIADTNTDQIANGSSSDIVVYPNPNTGYFTISALGKKEFDIIIYNVMGQVVYQAHSDNEKYLVANHLFQDGIYVAKVISDTQTVKLKVVVNK